MEKSQIPFFEKSEGTKSFKLQNYEEAIKHYSKVSYKTMHNQKGSTCDTIPCERQPRNGRVSEEADRRNYCKLFKYQSFMCFDQIPCNSNLSLCNMKIGKYESAIKFADEVFSNDIYVFVDLQVLKFDEQNLKALYRRGYSHMKRYNVRLYFRGINLQFGEAKQDLQLAKKLDPQDDSIELALKQLEKLLENQKVKEKAMSEKMLKGYKGPEKEKKSFFSRLKYWMTIPCRLCKRRYSANKSE